MKDLTGTQIEFLKILESFMHDQTYELPEDFGEIQALYKIAGKHQVSAAVYEQIRTSVVMEREEYRSMMQIWKHSAIRDIMLQMQRTEGFLVIYEKLCQAGLKPLVVKGLICRNMYSKSDYRISGDEDLLLPKEDFKICDQILRDEGFMREELDMEDLPYEVPYRNPRNGVYIELHMTLFSETSDAYGHLNDEFKEVFDHCMCETIQSRKVWTLSPTDHLFYLICHSFKHFLHSGFGIRQVADMIMMAEQYGDQIDWKDIKEKLSRLNMAHYWNALVGIGTSYLGFSLDKACYPKDMREQTVDHMPLLMDLLDGGIYGDSSMERKHSSNMTLTAVVGGTSNTAASLGSSLFPSKEYMKQRFSWVKKHPYLLPVGYVVRIVQYLKSSKRKPGDEKNSIQIGMERVELLKQYHIIK